MSSADLVIFTKDGVLPSQEPLSFTKTQLAPSTELDLSSLAVKLIGTCDKTQKKF